MKPEIRQKMIAGGWEFFTFFSLSMCVTMAFLSVVLIKSGFCGKAMCVFGAIYAACLLLGWVVRKLLKGEVRMGVYMSGCVMAVSLVILFLLFTLWNYGMVMMLIGGPCLLVWLVCFLSRKESGGQTLKSAWQLGCTLLMWGFSVACLMKGIGMLVETVCMPMEEPTVVTSPFDRQTENEGKMVRVQGYLETDDELEMPEWGVRYNALYIRVQSLGKGSPRFFREVSAKHFRLGEYRLAGIHDFRDFMKVNGVEKVWPAPFPLPKDAVTTLPPGLKEKYRDELVNTLWLSAKTDDADVGIEFCCYPCTPQCNVIVQGRQRGDTLEDVKVLRNYRRDTEVFNARSLQKQSRVPDVAGAFLMALVFYLVGGAKGHSILMFGCPALCWIFPVLPLLCAVLQSICVPSCDIGMAWLWLLLTVPLLYINTRVQRARARAAAESAGA